MNPDDRIEKLEARVDRLETSIDTKLAQIFDKLNALTLDSVRNACPSPGACIGLGKELEHAIKAHNATMLRVERIDIKLIECEREFAKLERQKAWVIGAWSAVAFCSSVVGAILISLLNYYLKK